MNEELSKRLAAAELELERTQRAFATLRDRYDEARAMIERMADRLAELESSPVSAQSTGSEGGGAG